MARTKQTATKTTGIEAPRLTIKRVPKCQAAAATALVVQHRRLVTVQPKLAVLPATLDTPDGAHFGAILTPLLDGNELGNNDVSHSFYFTVTLLSKTSNCHCQFATSPQHGRPTTVPQSLGLSGIPGVPDRVCLAAMQAAPLKRSSHTNNDFCHMCGDGGELFNCDSCPRAACRHCLEIPDKYLSLILDNDTTFLCVSCHWKDNVRSGGVTPYLVGFGCRLVKRLTNVSISKQGFYRDSTPILPTFLTIPGSFQLPIRSGISSRNTIVIHLRVHTLPPDGPVLMLQHFLQPYFTHSGQLIMKDLAFNLTTVATRKQYELSAAWMLNELGDIRGHNILITLTAHSEEERGDLTLGISLSEEDRSFILCRLRP
ncbi:hypothetical protein JVU11DRAFT_6189 [Chiua virens]|nr:hypothetical protein JVU11DRAFT_6189 [Chiua virens]